MAIDISCDFTATTQPSHIFCDSLNGGDTYPTLRETSVENGSFTCYGGFIWLRDKLNLTAIRIDYKWRLEGTGESALPQLNFFILADSHERIHKVVVTAPLEQIRSILHAINDNQTGYDLNQFWSYWENNCSRVQLGSIRRLDLSHCGLDSNQLCGVDLSRLTNLRSLKLDYNDIGNLPAQFLMNLPGKKLRKLSLRHTRMRQIPDWIGENLPKLKFLDVSHNRLTSIPESLAQLNYLKTLKIGHNQFGLLPLSLAKLILRNNNKFKYFAQLNRLSQDRYAQLTTDILNDPLPHRNVSSLKRLALQSTKMSFRQIKMATSEQLAIDMTRDFQVCPVCNRFFSDGYETLTFGMVKGKLEIHFKGVTCSHKCRMKAVVNGIQADPH